MTINRLKLRTAIGGEYYASVDICDLPLDGSGGVNPFVLKGAQGLDIGAISPIGYGTSDTGISFYTMRPEPRDIILRLGMNPNSATNQTYQDLRDGVYRTISWARSPDVIFELMDGEEVISHVSGKITRIDSDYFSSKPELQLTVSCDDSFFSAPIATEAVLTNPVPERFELTMSDGNAPTGFSMTVHINSPVSSWGLSEAFSNGEFNVDYVFEVGDIIHLSSEQGALDIYVTRGITNIPLADRVLPGAFWPVLFPGLNAFNLIGDPALSTITALVYYAKFWGV